MKVLKIDIKIYYSKYYIVKLKMPFNFHQEGIKQLEKFNNKKYWDFQDQLAKYRRDHPEEHDKPVPTWLIVAYFGLFGIAVIGGAIIYLR